MKRKKVLIAQIISGILVCNLLPAVKASSEDYISTLSVNNFSSSSVIKKLIYDEKSSDYIAVEIPEDEIRYDYIYKDDDGSDYCDIILKDSSCGYSYTIDEKADMDLSMRYENQLISVQSSNTNAVEFTLGNAKAYVQGGEFDISFTNNEGYYDLPWYNIEISGTASDSVTVSEGKYCYLVIGNNLDNITAEASNDNVTLTEKCPFKSDAVLITAEDENTIIFEDVSDDIDIDVSELLNIEKSDFNNGDVNLDNSVDIRDLTLIKQHIVKMIKLTGKNKVSADVIADNVIDVKDISQMIKYIIKLIDKL
ncbi:MAG: dockerin type I repeat-containing protein [Oscillospiraceae bacterium]